MGFEVLLKGNNAARLLGGLLAALRISLVSVVISIILGVLLGVLVTLRRPVITAIYRIYLETVRIMPQLVLLFIVFFGSTKALGLNLSAESASIIVFSFWGTAYNMNLQHPLDLIRYRLTGIL